jgi:hypothetical protein
MRLATVVLAASAVAAVAVAACSGATASPGGEAGGASGVPSGSGTEAQRAYCTSHGGMLVERVPVWNTNADVDAQLPLAGRATFCEFESKDAAGSATRISVDLLTLTSTEPTIAAVAYLSKVPPSLPSTPSENPAIFNCAALGGSAAFGNTAAGGGWVDEGQPVFKVMDQCVFADGSAIDAFGILYHAGGTVRGADLAPLFAYQPGNRLPAMFEKPRR